MALCRAVFVFLCAAALLPHTPEAIDPVRWLEHRGRGHRALLQEPVPGEQPQPGAAVSDVDAGGDTGAATVPDPEAEAAAVAAADASADSGTDPGVLSSDVPADSGVSSDVPVDSADPGQPASAAGDTGMQPDPAVDQQQEMPMPGMAEGQTEPSVPGEPAGQTELAAGEMQPGVPVEAAAAPPPDATAPAGQPDVAADLDAAQGTAPAGDQTSVDTAPGDAEAGTGTTSPGLNHGALAEALISERQHQAMGDTPAPPPPVVVAPYVVSEGLCGDKPPPGEYTCQDQKGFGKCDADFMLAGKHCDRTCGRCTGPCVDYAPPGPYGCAEQWQFGKCDEAFLRDYGYCDVTCGRCEAAPAPGASGEGVAEDSSDVTTPDQSADSDTDYGQAESAQDSPPAEGGTEQPADMPAPVFDEATSEADGLSPAAAADQTMPEASVDTLTSDEDSTPEEPPSGTGMAEGPAPEEVHDEHTDQELTAYQALLSGAYLRDLVSMEPKAHSVYAWVHGILMATAWGLIIPCGVLVSRYGKPWTHWFVTHRTVQTIGYLVVLAGYVMAFLMHHAGGAAHEEISAPEGGAAAPLAGDAGLSGDPLVGRRRRLLHEVHDDPARGRVAELHGLVGYIVLGMFTLQVLAHVLRPGKDAVGRAAWGWYHWAVGWAVLGLASINVFQGLALIDAGRWYVLGYALAVATYIGGVMFVEIRRCVYGHELEGYKHANERGDLEMVGGSHEEREGILGSYGNGLLHDVGDDSDEDLTMLRRADQAKFAQD